MKRQSLSAIAGLLSVLLLSLHTLHKQSDNDSYP